MTKLMEWLKAPGEGRTQEELGRKVKLSQGRISQIARNGTSDFHTALAIQTATDEEVTVADLLRERKKRAQSATANGAAG